MNKNISILLVLIVLVILGWVLHRSNALPFVDGLFNNNSGEQVGGEENPTDTAPVTGGCYVGGCSSQLCSDQPDMVSTCEFRAEYACYQTAQCERQSDGQCGWTPTTALTQCLSNPPQL